MARRLLSVRVLLSVRCQSSRAEKITVRGDDVPEAIADFDSAGFPEKIVSKLKQKYDKPSPIQGITWPVALHGRDLISVAKTGSGKTLGFMLPGIVHTLKVPRRPPGSGPTALVLAPTRELAQQVNNVAVEYAPMLNRNTTCLFGGAARSSQEIILRQGVDICIATPGRLLDFLRSGVTSLDSCSYLVLDEADRMLDMGFEPQIREIVDNMKAQQRQTLMFSATWPDEVRNLAADFHTDPVFLNVGSLELSANPNIEQVIEVVNEAGKQERLPKLLGQLLKEKDAKILIFTETKNKADGLARAISRIGWRSMPIHGDKTQLQRDNAMRDFRSGRIPILVATNVAARGIDVPDIKAVINYDCPNNVEDYVHRIGRTGRGEKSGTAYTYFTPQEAFKARDLIKVLVESGQEVPNELKALTHSHEVEKGRQQSWKFNQGNRNSGRRQTGFEYSNRGRYKSRW